ncbi:hypothetical protein N8370_04370 [Amylibacter sp.]|nr:hypothetical protein [Amylibacter sp.]
MVFEINHIKKIIYKKTKSNKFYLISLLITLSLLHIFLDSKYFFVFQALNILLLLLSYFLGDNFFERVIILFIISIPISWTSVFGPDGIKVNLYFLSICILYFYFLIKIIQNFKKIIIYDKLLIVSGLISLAGQTVHAILSDYRPVSIFDFISCSPVYFPLFLYLLFKYLEGRVCPIKIIHIFIVSALSVALFLIYQQISLINGDEIGRVFIRKGRISFGAHFFEFSVLSSYLLQAFILTFLFYKTFKVPFRLLTMIILSLILIIGLVSTAARIGVLAIVVSSVITSLIMLSSFNLRKFLLVIFALCLGMLAYYLLTLARPTVGDEGFSDDTRLELWSFWINYYLDSPFILKFFGQGFSYPISIVPTVIKFQSHNLVIDSFLSGGVIFSIYLFSLLIEVFKMSKGRFLFLFFVIAGLITFLAANVIQARVFGLFMLIIVLYLKFPNNVEKENLSIKKNT